MLLRRVRLAAAVCTSGSLCVRACNQCACGRLRPPRPSDECLRSALLSVKAVSQAAECMHCGGAPLLS